MKKLIFLIIFLTATWANAATTIVASRTSGVAPLAVHFYDSDATGSGGVFHTDEYSWTFDDSSSGTWGTDSKSKNSAKGPVTAHVFESAGTYTVTLTVTNSTGTVGTDTETITVTAPDTVFATTATTCINPSGDSDFTGCPTGANQVQSDDLTTIATNSYDDAGERILLKRGESWTLTTEVNWDNNTGPVYIGAYGSGAKPAITISNSNTEFLNLSNKRDWRLIDIACSATRANNGISMVYGNEDFRNNLILRCEMTGGLYTMWYYHTRDSDASLIDANAIVECDLNYSYTINLYIGGERSIILGNDIDRSETSHVFRSWQGYRAVIQHNRIYSAGETGGVGRGAQKFHGPVPLGNDAESNTALQGTYAAVEAAHDATRAAKSLLNKTELAVISDNVFGASGASPINMRPQDGNNDEVINDIIFERNLYLADYGVDSGSDPRKLMRFWGSNITIRNNIFYGVSDSSGLWAISMEEEAGTATWSAPDGNKIYNNTIYSPSTHSNQAFGIETDTRSTNTVVRNNLVYFPADAGTEAVLDDNASDTTESNNLLISTSYFTDPENVTPLSRDFTLTTDTAAGYNLLSAGVLEDYAGDSRTSAFSIGAYGYGLGVVANTQITLGPGASVNTNETGTTWVIK